MAGAAHNLFLAAAALLHAQAAAGEDAILTLSCKGTNRQGPAHFIGDAAPWQDRLRIDKGRKSYCWGSCAEWHEWSRAEGKRLVLVSRPTGELAVDLKSGKLQMDMSYGDLVVIRRGWCRPARDRG